MKDSVDDLTHLFFVNGNGISFKNGNPVVSVEFNRTIEFKNYFKECKEFDEMIWQYKENNLDSKINDLYTSKLRYAKILNKSEDQCYADAVKEIAELYENLERIEDNLNDVNYYITLIEESEYFPSLRLSKNYFKLEQLNEHTEETLLNIAINLSQAYIEFYENLTTIDILKYKPLMRFDDTEEYLNDITTIIETDLKILTEELTRLAKIKG
jgi:hypothetical protein